MQFQAGAVKQLDRPKLKFTHQKALILSLNYWFLFCTEKLFFT